MGRFSFWKTENLIKCQYRMRMGPLGLGIRIGRSIGLRRK